MSGWDVVSDSAFSPLCLGQCPNRSVFLGVGRVGISCLCVHINDIPKARHTAC